MGRYTFLVIEDCDYEKTELELSGLDPEKLGFMNSKERRETLLKAGLVPEEWDFWGNIINFTMGLELERGTSCELL